MADAMEAAGEHVQKKATDELAGVERHGLHRLKISTYRELSKVSRV